MSSKRNRSECWTGVDHAERNARNDTRKKQHIIDRTALLTHNTREKRDAQRLKLHITKTQRKVNELRQRLKGWDPVTEQNNFIKKQKEEEEERRRQEEQPRKKKGRLGPESWKLRGAARPAWEVYDFDVRYVDPHIKAHEDATKKAQRSINVLTVYKGKFGTIQKPDNKNNNDSTSNLLASVAREYLVNLMELGYLSYESKQYKTARSVWFECLELEGTGAMTSARECLLRMYIELDKHDACMRLYHDKQLFFDNDTSTWIRYSIALSSYQLKYKNQKSIDKRALKKDKDKQGDDLSILYSTEKLMIQAIKSNVFCAYYLVFYDTFTNVMEYTDEIEFADDQPESTFEEAIEYCNNKVHVNLWQQKTSEDVNSNAVDMLRNILFNRKLISSHDLEWDHKLTRIVQEYEYRKEQQKVMNKNNDNDDDSSVDDDKNKRKKMHTQDKGFGENDEEEDDDSSASDIDNDESSSNQDDVNDNEEIVELPMFAGMFRTGMEMLEHAGLLPT